MTQHRIELATALGTQSPPYGSKRGAVARTPWSARLAARIFADRYDRAIENRVPVTPGSALAAHAARIVASREREELGRALRSALRRANEPRGGGLSYRIPLHAARIAAAENTIDEVTLRLHAPLPVRARGMARLRLLLSDGAGPLFDAGHGSLAAELRGVLAAL